MLIVLVESVFYGLNILKASRVSGEDPYLFAFSETMGYVPQPNAEARAYKREGGELLYDVVYRTDEFGRRITPQSTPDAGRFILFFGCSYVWGEGVAEDETLPAHAARLMPGVRVYNYGFSGYGPQQMLAKLESGELPRELPEKSGTLVYVFMCDHVRRAVGALRMWAQWGRHFPYYTIDDDGALVRRGSFFTGRPWRSRFYDTLKREQIMAYFNVDIPIRTRPEDTVLAARIVSAARDRFLDAWPDGRFLTLIYPWIPECKGDSASFTAALTDAGVEVLDYSNLLDMTAPGYRIPHDLHPAAQAHHAVAERLLHDLSPK